MANVVPGTFKRISFTHTVEERPKKRMKKGDEEKKGKKDQVEFDSKSDMDPNLDTGVPAPELAEWDYTSLPENFFMVLEGKRRTGKSTFAKWILQYYQNQFALVWCMTNTSASGYWQEFVGDAFTFDTWRPDAVMRLIQRNDAIIKKFGEESPKSKELASTLIILDDVVSSKIHDDMMFKTLAVEGRHHMIAVILATQDPKAVSPLVRDNSDVAIIFNQKTFRNKESIWHDFMNDTTKKFALSMLMKYSIEHEALVSVQTNLNGKISKCFFKSTGDKTKLKDPDYCLGGPSQKQIILGERAKKKADAPKKKQAVKDAKEEPSEIKRMTVSIFQ